MQQPEISIHPLIGRLRLLFRPSTFFGSTKNSNGLNRLKSIRKGHAAFNSLRVLKLNLPKLTSLDCYNIFSFKFSLNCLQFLRPSKALRTNVRAMKYVDCCGRASNCFNIQLL